MLPGFVKKSSLGCLLMKNILRQPLGCFFIVITKNNHHKIINIITAHEKQFFLKNLSNYFNYNEINTIILQMRKICTL